MVLSRVNTSPQWKVDAYFISYKACRLASALQKASTAGIIHPHLWFSNSLGRYLKYESYGSLTKTWENPAYGFRERWRKTCKKMFLVFSSLATFFYYSWFISLYSTSATVHQSIFSHWASLHHSQPVYFIRKKNLSENL